MSILPYNSWILSFGSVEEKMNREGSIRMIICKRSFYPVDHLQEVFLSCWSFAINWSIQMIICKRPVIPDDHLQGAGPSGWSFARGPPYPDDHLQEACPSGWSFARGLSIPIRAGKSDLWKSISKAAAQGALNRFYPPCIVNAASDVLDG